MILNVTVFRNGSKIDEQTLTYDEDSDAMNEL